MKNYCRIDHENRQIIMDRTFAKNSENTRSDEYAHLQQVRRDYPDYTVTRRAIKTNPNKKTYKGLTYDYMRRYIMDCKKPAKERLELLSEFDKLYLISQCQSKSLRYPVIKHWFFEKFPEIENFGVMLEIPEEDEAILEESDVDTIEEEAEDMSEKKSA